MLFAAILFVAAYIPLLPAPAAVYALHSVRDCEGAFAYMYSKNALSGTVFTGEYYRLHIPVKDIKSTKETLNFDFITVKLTGSGEKLLKELDIKGLTVTKIAGGTLYTGWSPVVSGRDIAVGTRRVNVQVFISSGGVIVGSPTIYGGY